MGASQRIAGPCLKSSVAAEQAPDVRRAGAPDALGASVVRGGGVVRHSHRDYYAIALNRYDGRRVSIRATADNAALEVFVDSRLLCLARPLPPDDDAGPVPAIEPPAPDRGGACVHGPSPRDASLVRCHASRRGRPEASGDGRPQPVSLRPSPASVIPTCGRHPGRDRTNAEMRRRTAAELSRPRSETSGGAGTPAARGPPAGAPACRRPRTTSRGATRHADDEAAALRSTVRRER